MSEEKRKRDKVLADMFPNHPEIAECFIGILDVIAGPVATAEPPQLIQGYTAEQWQEIIDGGYLCEFSNNNIHWSKAKWKLEKLIRKPTVSFHGDMEPRHYCRPAQIKGVMRPIFVEPDSDDDNVMVCLFDSTGFPLNNIRSKMSYAIYLKRKDTHYEYATKYIEV